jgi:DNA-binding transcriptional regulator GbsR (MarR family)
LVQPGRRPADIVAFEGVMVDFFVDAAELLGVPKSVAAIYGIVFASPTPLSFADIESRLDISKGSVSQGLRVLREVGALREVSGDADRAELFEPDLEMRKMMQRFLENRLARQLERGGTRLGQLAKILPKGRNGEGAVLRARVKQLQNWNTKARALLPMARTFLKLGG